MVQVENFVWPQGEDLSIELIYKEGPDAETATAVDLSTGYAVRMDIVVPATKERVYTFNSEEIADVDPGTEVVPDSTIEATFPAPAPGEPNIVITVPRALTLPGGEIYQQFSGGVSLFNYDLFLRNNSTNKQARILKGTITIEESTTLWL